MIPLFSDREITITNKLGPPKIVDFLRTLTTIGRLNLEFKISACNGQVHNAPTHPGSEVQTAPAPSPELCVELSGPDTPLLTDRNGELLHAIEHIAAKILRLEPEHHDRISFDAANFKANRDRDLRLSAAAAIQSVNTTGKPYAFPPMTSRERRLLHLALVPSGLPTASTGEVPRRFVVLYPHDYQIIAPPAANQPRRISDAAPGSTPDRASSIRNAFRRR